MYIGEINTPGAYSQTLGAILAIWIKLEHHEKFQNSYNSHFAVLGIGPINDNNGFSSITWYQTRLSE